MYTPATCVCSLYRGETEDSFGDPVPNNGASGLVASGVLANVEEKTSRVWDPGTNTPRVVRFHVGRVPSNVDVRIKDRLYCTVHDEWYRATNVTKPRSFGRVPDTVLELERVTTTGTGVN